MAGAMDCNELALNPSQSWNQPLEDTQPRLISAAVLTSPQVRRQNSDLQKLPAAQPQ